MGKIKLKTTLKSLKQAERKNKRKMSNNNKRTNGRDISTFKPEDRKDILAVREVLAGNKEAYSQIVNRYRPHLIQRYFLSVKDRDIAEDLASEVLVRAYQKLSLYKQDFTFNAWITRIADNFLVDWSRKAECRMRKATVSYDNIRSYEDGGGEESFVNLMGDPSAVTDSGLETEEKRRILRDGLKTLSDTERKLIGMFYGKEMTYEEIAKELNMNTNTMRCTLLRAKRNLAEYVSRAYPELKVAPKAAKTLGSSSLEKVLVDGEEHFVCVSK